MRNFYKQEELTRREVSIRGKSLPAKELAQREIFIRRISSS